jgi:hypothetical protein
MIKTLTAVLMSLFMLTSCSKQSEDDNKENPEPNNEFFTFEFKGTTYNLVAFAVSPMPDGYAVQGITSLTSGQGVMMYINTKTSSATISLPFGDPNETGKSGVTFNLPNQSVIYSTAGYDCRGRYTYSQGSAKLTAIGEVGKYFEGNVSGVAFYNEKNCPANEPVITESFRGSFKILRKM